MDVLKKVPVREQNPQVRATNFEEVCLGYNKEEAMSEANRCIGCKNAQCVKGCPVAIDIPGFIGKVKEGNIEEAYQIISESSALPAVCGRESRDASTGARHEWRRLCTQKEPDRLRLPSAVRLR